MYILPVELIKGRPEKIKEFLSSKRYLEASDNQQAIWRQQLEIYDPNSFN